MEIKDINALVEVSEKMESIVKGLPENVKEKIKSVRFTPSVNSIDGTIFLRYKSIEDPTEAISELKDMAEKLNEKVTTDEGERYLEVFFNHNGLDYSVFVPKLKRIKRLNVSKIGADMIADGYIAYLTKKDNIHEGDLIMFEVKDDDKNIVEHEISKKHYRVTGVHANDEYFGKGCKLINFEEIGENT